MTDCYMFLTELAAHIVEDATAVEAVEDKVWIEISKADWKAYWDMRETLARMEQPCDE